MFPSLFSIKEQSFLILVTRVEDFWQGYETFFHHFMGVRNFQGKCLCGTKLFYWKMAGHILFSIFKMGYEFIFNYVKLSSTLVPRIKNYCSLSWLNFHLKIFFNQNLPPDFYCSTNLPLVNDRVTVMFSGLCMPLAPASPQPRWLLKWFVLALQQMELSETRALALS